MVRRVCRGLAALALPASVAAAHPLHTSLAQIDYDAARRALTISVRVFADDFGAAVARSERSRLRPGDPVPEAAMHRYVAARLALATAAGSAIPLAWCGARRTGEMLFLCLRAAPAPPPSGLRLRHALLVESFDDQVNIVQYPGPGARRTILFTGSGGVKPLR